MVTKPEKGKYLTLEDVRIHYDENKDSIVLTSKDPDIPAGKSIYLNLNNGRGAEKVLREMLENAGMIEPEKFKTFPESVSYDNVPEDQPWYALPLGVRPNKKTVFWDPNTTGNLLIWGHGTFDKENADNNLIRHCVNNSDHWTVSVIDYRAAGTDKYSQYRPVVEKIASDDETMLAVIDNAYREMRARQVLTDDAEVFNYLDLESKLPAHLVIIDDIGVRELVESNNLRLMRQFHDLLKEGRNAGIHIALSGRGMSTVLSVITEDYLNFFQSRLVTGKVEYMFSQWILGNGKASCLEDVKGRAFFQEFGKGLELQSYFSIEPDHAD